MAIVFAVISIAMAGVAACSLSWRGVEVETNELAQVVSDGGAVADASAVSTRLSASLTVPTLCRDHGHLEGVATNAVGVRARWAVDSDVEEAAEAVVKDYSNTGAELIYDGYIDLLGRVWACAVSSKNGWCEYAVIDGRDREDPFAAVERERGEPCLVTVVRLSGAQLQRESLP